MFRGAKGMDGPYFPYRRGWILDTAATRSVSDIIGETPLLKKTIYVSYPLEYTL